MALEIAIGIWLGGIALGGTVAILVTIKDHIERNRRRGEPWYRF